MRSFALGLLMALTAFLDAFNSGTGAATTTVVRTGYGFQPKAILVWCTKLTGTADEVSGALDGGMSFGFATGATARRCIAHQTDDAALASVTDCAHRDDAIIAMLSTAGAIEALLDIQSFDSDGITFVVDDAFPASYRVMVLALGGDDLTNAEVGTYSTTTAVATQNVTTVSFQPDSVLLLSAGFASAPPGAGTGGAFNLGAADTAFVNACLSSRANDGSANMSTRGYCRSGDGLAAISQVGGTIDSRARVTAWLSNGFTLTYDDQAAGLIRVFYLALKGGQFAIKTGTTQTDTTTDIVVSGTGFTPVAGLVVSACRAQDAAGTITNHQENAIGAFTGASAERAMTFWDENATAADECAMAQENDACYVNISTGDAVEGIMQVQSVDSDGVTFRMADADPSGSFFWTLLFGNAAGGDIELVVADALIALGAETPSLTQANTLAVADALIALSAESPSLTQANVLAVADALISLSAESPDLTQANVLAVADALIALAAENPTLETGTLLAVADALIALSAESPDLTQQNVLAVADALIALAVDTPTLEHNPLLTVADALIALAVESPDLTQASTLAVADALIALGIGSPTISPDVAPEPAVVGKYEPEHDSALVDLAAATGFQPEHDSALVDIEAATGFRSEHGSALRDLREAGV